MKELLQILNKANELKTSNQPFALATVVKIGGSTYRRPGARMLVTAEGERWGTISGGCLEGEVAEQAVEVIENRRAMLLPFNLEEDDIVLGFGTGCNGIVHVLIQPVLAGNAPNPIDALQFSIEQRMRGILATVIEADTSAEYRPGQFALLTENRETGPASLSESSMQSILPYAHGLIDEELKKEHTYLWHTRQIATPSGQIDVLYEIVRPPVNLFVFGEGHDVHAIVHQGALMGWNVHVIGRKPAEVLAHRFPGATSCQFLMHPEEAANIIHPDARSAALVMNHTYVRDKSIMYHLLQSTIPYVGMLGPRERTQDVLDELETEGKGLTQEQQLRLFGPVGLDIGTETPEEIALSTIAEIQATLHGRKGGSLKQREGPIHSQRVPIESFN